MISELGFLLADAMVSITELGFLLDEAMVSMAELGLLLGETMISMAMGGLKKLNGTTLIYIYIYITCRKVTYIPIQ